MTSLTVSNTTNQPEVTKKVADGGQRVVDGGMGPNHPQVDGLGPNSQPANVSDPASLLQPVSGSPGQQQVQAQRQQQQAEDEQQQAVSPQQMADSMNEIADQQGWSLRFQEYEDTGQRIVNIVDADNGELIKTIPSEEFLETSKRIHELLDELDSLSGIFVQGQA